MNGIVQAGINVKHKSFKLPMHFNNGLEIVYISGGNAQWRVDNHVETVYPGSVFFTLPWQFHGNPERISPGVELFFVILELRKQYPAPTDNFQFHESLLLPQADEERISRTLFSSCAHCFKAGPDIEWLLPKLVKECSSDYPDRELMTASLARALILELERSINSHTQTNETGIGNAENRVKEFLAKLQSHPEKTWTLDSMAKTCGIHRTRFSQLVRKLTADPPMMYLNRLRVAKARQELSRSRLSITEIAFKCGFTTSQYFAKVFKDYTNMSPREFRGENQYRELKKNFSS